MTWSDDVTLMLSRQEAIYLSSKILEMPKPRHPYSESIRKKLRAGLDHRIRMQEDDEASIGLLEHEYRRRSGRGLVEI